MHQLFISIAILLVIIEPSFSKAISEHHHFRHKSSLSKCRGGPSSGDRVRVFITVSSLSLTTSSRNGSVERQLEVNWLGRAAEGGDRVAIYGGDPRGGGAAPLLFQADPALHPGGYLRTTVKLSFLFFDLAKLSQDPCLGYWAGYSDGNGVVLDASCLQTRPFWMEEISPFLANQTLDEIMIPGSHDSGSFHVGHQVAPLVRYKYAQEEPIFNQLVYGLRYFDLRVGFYNDSRDKFFINHNFLRTEHTVESVLQQVMKFVKAAKKEIVILDFHNFPIGFHDERPHLMLMQMVVKKFKNLLVPFDQPDEPPTIGYLWRKNRRVLVSYNSHHRKLLKQNLLWPGIVRAWGNKQHPQDLRRYFKDVFSQRLPKGLWASMAELTPNARTILLHPATGLRVFADEINRNVTRWFRDLYWKKANIVATDYFLGNNMIDVAIETNVLKAHCPRTKNVVW